MSGKRYTEEFKVQAMRHVTEGKHKVAEVAARLSITTNKSVRDWTELLAGDEALATAILDRLLHKANVLNIKGRSYRLRDLDATLGTDRA